MDQTEVARLERERLSAEMHAEQAAMAPVTLPPKARLGFAMSLGPVGTAISSLGIVGCIVVVLMVVNTIASLSNPAGGGHFVIPWATLLVLVRRAWTGRWLAAIIIGGTWLAAVLLTLAAHPIAL